MSNDPVAEFTLQSPGGLRLSLVSLGARMHKLWVPVPGGEPIDVLLGREGPEEYRADHAYFGAICGRVANRIGSGRFDLDGREFRLGRNLGEHHLHGGAVGFDRRTWAGEQIAPDTVRFTYSSSDGEEGYPGTVESQVVYSLREPGAVRIETMATTDAPTLVNLVNHAYFNLNGGGSPGGILDHSLEIAADAFTPVDASGLPTGEILPVSGTALDFRRPRTPGSRIRDAYLKTRAGYDHNFVLRSWRGERSGTEEPVFAARLSNRALVLEVFTTTPGLQLYTGNFLGGPGKSRRPYAPHAGLCLECQHFPDAIHHPRFPSIVLRPGDTYRQTTIYRFRSN